MRSPSDNRIDAELVEQIAGHYAAGIRVIQIITHERSRVRDAAFLTSRNIDESDMILPVYCWSISSGVREITSRGLIELNIPTLEDDLNTDEYDVCRHIKENKGIWILEDLHSKYNQPDRKIIDFLRQIASHGDTLVILSTPESSLPLELQKEVASIDLPLPDIKLLQSLAESVCSSKKEISIDDQVIEAARGLTSMEAKVAFRKALRQCKSLDINAATIVAKEKAQVIRRSQILEYFEHDAEMSEVGGMENLKDWLKKRKIGLRPVYRRHGLEPPKGVMLLGVQGCGKSLVAKTIAHDWNLPLLRFDLGKVFGGIVGQSEANMRLALKLAQALAPCTLWIDEIEKGLAGINSSDRTDGGTTARVIGTLLTWMQEKKEPVFVVATANNILQLPPELLRKGRFDEIFFVDLPTKDVRETIFRIHLSRKNKKLSSTDLKKLAGLTSGFSGAEIEQCVNDGLYNWLEEGTNSPTCSHFETAINETKPLAHLMHEAIRKQREWAKDRTRPAALGESESLDSLPRVKLLRTEDDPDFFAGDKRN
jgi:SpoVK/Ycf46/Vps4 family AAA+-type ATPase